MAEDEMSGSLKAVIIDNGSGLMKAGFEGDVAPRCVFPNVVGRPHYRLPVGFGPKENYVGFDAQAKRGILNLSHPIEHGQVSDWEDMERIWEYTFESELEVNPADHPVLLSEPPLNTSKSREMMAEIMFEKFNCCYTYFAVQAMLSLYASGEMGGVVVECGDGVTQIVPVYGAYIISHAIVRLDVAGRDLSEYMRRLVSQERGFNFDNTAEFELACDLKEKTAYVAYDYERALRQKAKEKSYTLPDGQVLTVGSERFRCAEALFHPELLGLEQPGLHEATYDAILKCPTEIRKILLEKTVLSGGSTMLPGIVPRMEKELTTLAPSTIPVRIISPSERRYSAWIGGSILASLTTFRKFWIKKEDFEEDHNVVQTNCFSYPG